MAPWLRASAPVAVGGAGGTLCRWALTALLGPAVGLTIANLIGAALLGAAVGARRVRPWLTTGFCGACTSVSALSVGTLDDPTAMAPVLVVCLLGALPAVAVGRRLGEAS